ncbi:MAG TPA: hypothetical protein VN873_05430 [Candidatus Angelobacter sp.]|nr:hypothetical protein [Candidatus Angelobacter sp.]
MSKEVQDLQLQVNGIENQLRQQRDAGIEKVVNELVSNCQLTASEAPKAIARAKADPTYLDELRARPAILPGNEPLNFAAVTTMDDSVRNAVTAMGRFTCAKHSGPDMVFNAAQRSARFNQIWQNERTKLLPVLNAAANNAVDANLKRVLILNEIVRDFAIKVLPLRLFSTVYQNVPLQGTDTVAVPYYPLQAAASSDFDVVNGYQFGQATNTLSKPITVNKRKYQPMDYSSQEFRRQPMLNVIQLGKLNAEKLGVDILADIMSVITLANFGAAVKNIAAAAYTSDDVVDLKSQANQLFWPQTGRSLIVDDTVGTALEKDSDYKLALNIGTTDVIQEGKFPRLSGFDFASMPNFPTNGESLLGVIAFASAILAAFAPVDPADGVRQQLSAYEIATEPMTGISLNYRKWGVAQADRTYEIIESAYGYAPGVANSMRRLTAP